MKGTYAICPIKKFLAVALVSALLSATGCGDNRSSPSSAGGESSLLRVENSVTTSTGGVIYLIYDERAVVGEVIRLQLRFREPGIAPGMSTGTLNWGDNTTDRVRDDATVRINHIYRMTGTYNFTLQPDGGEKVVIGTIVVLPPVASIENNTAQATGVFGNTVCIPNNGIASIDSDVSLNFGQLVDPTGPSFVSFIQRFGAACDKPIFSPNALSVNNSNKSLVANVSSFGCVVGDVFSVKVEAIVPDLGTASCFWTVVP